MTKEMTVLDLTKLVKYHTQTYRKTAAGHSIQWLCTQLNIAIYDDNIVIMLVAILALCEFIHCSCG